MKIALFGVLTEAVITRLADHTLRVTDSPSDADTVNIVRKTPGPMDLRPAAWSNLDHPLSTEDIRTYNGAAQTYNRNGGYVRDAILAETSDAVVVGDGVPPRRLEVIIKYAEAGDTPVRYMVTPPSPKLAREVVERELDALGLEAQEAPF